MKQRVIALVAVLLLLLTCATSLLAEDGKYVWSQP